MANVPRYVPENQYLRFEVLKLTDRPDDSYSSSLCEMLMRLLIALLPTYTGHDVVGTFVSQSFIKNMVLVNLLSLN